MRLVGVEGRGFVVGGGGGGGRGEERGPVGGEADGRGEGAVGEVGEGFDVQEGEEDHLEAGEEGRQADDDLLGGPVLAVLDDLYRGSVLSERPKAEERRRTSRVTRKLSAVSCQNVRNTTDLTQRNCRERVQRSCPALSDLERARVRAP